MNATQFEKEIKNIDPRFSVAENPNRPGLSNIFFMGRNYDLPVISTHEIKTEIDHTYQYEFPNGLRARYWTQGEVKDRLNDFLKDFNGGKYDGLYE